MATAPPAEVTVVGGDPVIGEALEALLRAAGYHARFLFEPAADGLAEALARSRLLVVAPTLSAEFSRAFLEAMLDPEVKAPVLELLPADGEQRLPGAHILLWPSSMAKLERAIDAALREEG
jgi:hypothetical protein